MHKACACVKKIRSTGSSELEKIRKKIVAMEGTIILIKSVYYMNKSILLPFSTSIAFLIVFRESP